MNLAEEFSPILSILLQRSRKDEVNWQSPSDSFGHDAFEVKLPQSVVSIQRVQPTAEADYYRVAILNNQGQLVFSASASEEPQSPEEADWLEILRDLYEDASRSVTGWDKVLDDLRSAVQGERPVGLLKK